MGKMNLPDHLRAVPLSKGGFAIVDAADYARVSAHRWHRVSHGSINYAASYIRDESGKTVRIYLHAFIIGDLPAGMVRDHICGCGLCCQRSNLRPVTPLQNARNRSRCGKSGFYGVRWNPQTCVWQALSLRDLVTKRRRVVGAASTAEEAARIRDAWVLANAPDSGERLNFDGEGRRIVHDCQFDHGLPQHQRRVKSTPYHGVSRAEDGKDGQAIYVANAMINKRKFPSARYRDEVQCARHVDEIFQAHGLPRPNFPDVSPLVISLGVSYTIAR